MLPDWLVLERVSSSGPEPPSFPWIGRVVLAGTVSVRMRSLKSVTVTRRGLVVGFATRISGVAEIGAVRRDSSPPPGTSLQMTVATFDAFAVGRPPGWSHPKNTASLLAVGMKRLDN